MAVHLQRTLAEKGDGLGDPVLVTVDAEGIPHTSMVRVALSDQADTLVVEPAPRTWPGCEAAGRNRVTLFWPPSRSGDHNLIVDGIAAADIGGTGLTVSSLRAVLHRRVPAPPGTETSCGWDCVPLE
ncbi:MAG TPA: pyridoxamine 5'-phosphate oxidase family protein [Actinomycetota bacterium]|nr:pyridoxamine 5'-phosphate oxidase family protein [Actinomycetota bacterium]